MKRSERRLLPLLPLAMLGLAAAAAAAFTTLGDSSSEAVDQDLGGGEGGRALIFDCDGTLVDTETPYMDAFNQALALYTDAMPVDTVTWGRELSGRGLETDAEYAVREFKLNATADEFLRHWKRNFGKLTNRRGSIRLLDGFDELIAHAKRRGWKVAVASSSDRAGLRRKLKNGVLAHSHAISRLSAFDTIVSNDDVSKHKPDPEIYLLAAKRLGVEPKNCWVVEDSATGVLAGKRAGMRVAAVPNEYTRGTNDFRKADVVLKSMAEVVGVLDWAP